MLLCSKVPQKHLILAIFVQNRGSTYRFLTSFFKYFSPLLKSVIYWIRLNKGGTIFMLFFLLLGRGGECCFITFSKVSKPGLKSVKKRCPFLNTFYFLNMISFEVGYFLVWYRVQNHPKKSDFCTFRTPGTWFWQIWTRKGCFGGGFGSGRGGVCIKDKLLEMVWYILTIWNVLF